ncbi:unnamed protein product [Calicophoron daubneyi]|uniref:UDENN domain-containing protein n=1 Tax=Calicophoron daubneyi TaxID=300641 RepID=A0AAV2T4A0_CALDB
MFSTRLRPTSTVLECIVILDVSDSSKGCVFEYCCPSGYPYQTFLAKLCEFAYPCGHKSSLSEEYTLIFTDSNGKLEFNVCLLLPLSGYIVCIRSFRPWFDLLHGLLSLINQEQLFLPDLRYHLELYVEKLIISNGLVLFDVAPSHKLTKFSMPVPDARVHPFYPRYLLEYYNTLSISNWIIIMENLLMERSVVFYSSRFQRITSCALASLSLLYPLTWVHLVYPLLSANCIDYIGCPSPFVAGIHSCLVEKVKAQLGPGILLVDLDADVIYTTEKSECCFPNVIRQWLVRRCNRSHRSILRHSHNIKSAATTAAAFLVEPYLELMAILLGGYREATSYVEPSVNSGLPSSQSGVSKANIPFDEPRPGRWFFDRNIFIGSRGRECRTYLRDLLHSQMVIEFLQSRVVLLNSDLGMIPMDDFEDTISRVPKLSRPSLPELLRRGRTGFGRLAQKIGGLKEKRSEQKRSKGAPTAFYISWPKPGQVTSNIPSPGAQTDPALLNDNDSSSNSSADLELPPIQENSTVAEMTPTSPMISNPEVFNVNYEESGPWHSLPPVGDVRLRETERTRRSLMSSILNSVPDIPPDWLKPPPDWTCPDSMLRERVSPDRGAVQRPTPVTQHVGSTDRLMVQSVVMLSPQRVTQTSDPLDLFDPYRPIRKAPEHPTASRPPNPNNDLSSFISSLDPLRATKSGDEGTNLLK